MLVDLRKYRTDSGHRLKKLDCQALEKDVKENPELRLIDADQKFSVAINAIF